MVYAKPNSGLGAQRAERIARREARISAEQAAREAANRKAMGRVHAFSRNDLEAAMGPMQSRNDSE